jgi:hypothetical protein
VLSFVFRTGRAIPIASARETRGASSALYDEIAKAPRMATSSAHALKARSPRTVTSIRSVRGITRIIERTPVPVVALALPRAVEASRGAADPR